MSYSDTISLKEKRSSTSLTTAIYSSTLKKEKGVELLIITLIANVFSRLTTRKSGIEDKKLLISTLYITTTRRVYILRSLTRFVNTLTTNNITLNDIRK